MVWSSTSELVRYLYSYKFMSVHIYTGPYGLMLDTCTGAWFVICMYTYTSMYIYMYIYIHTNLYIYTHRPVWSGARQ